MQVYLRDGSVVGPSVVGPSVVGSSVVGPSSKQQKKKTGHFYLVNRNK